MTDNRNYFKLAGYLMAIGVAALSINWIYQGFVAEWNKQSTTVTSKSNKQAKTWVKYD